jgi:hypothetical protein
MDCHYEVNVHWACENCGFTLVEEQHGFGDTYWTVDGSHVLGERKRCAECGLRMDQIDVTPVTRRSIKNLVNLGSFRAGAGKREGSGSVRHRCATLLRFPDPR